MIKQSLPSLQKPLAISMGEPAGIGPDLLLRLYADRERLDIPSFIVYGNLDFLRSRAARLGLDFGMAPCRPDSAISQFALNLPVVEVPGNVGDEPGLAHENGARAVIQSIKLAVSDCLSGECAGLITAPINKAALKNVGFEFPGHTEFLAHLCQTDEGTPTPIMMLAHEELRVIPLTIHVALAKVPSMIKRGMIVDHVEIIANEMTKRFGVKNPKICITGLNPHAGENGVLGDEDAIEISPAIADLQQIGIDAHGPVPADTAFHLPNWKQFDVVVAMYHDQALIPIKTVAFEEAVNVTLGLPIIRTSPDHGTAYDIAGTGSGSVNSMMAALRLAARMVDGAHK